MAKFILNDPETEQFVEVNVVQLSKNSNFLEICPKGYGNSFDGPGPICLDFYNGRLTLLLNLDPTKEEPERFDLEPLKQ